MEIHEHRHGEGCSCGHNHNHEHHHDHDGVCGCGQVHDKTDAVHVETHLHDEARVISGRLKLVGDYDAVRKTLAAQLEATAANVQAQGSIVGHIKASCEVSLVEMFSVTDTEVSIKKAPDQEINIIVAAILFLLEPEEAEALVKQALTAVYNSVKK